MPSPNENTSLYLNVRYRTLTYTNEYGVTTGPSAWSITGQALRYNKYSNTVSVKTPNFKKLRKYQLPINDYSKSIIVRYDPLNEWQAVVRWQSGNLTTSTVYQYEGNCQSRGCDFNGIASAEDPSRGALMKLLNSISDTKVNTMVAAAEFNKTVAHVAKTATRVYGAIRSLKHGDFRGFTNSLGITSTEYQKRRFNKRFNRAKSDMSQDNRFSSQTMTFQRQNSRMSSFMSETWLEYSYGWKPLLKDVFDHAKALAELQIERQNVIRFASGRHRTKLKTALRSKAPGSLETYLRESNDERWCEYGAAFKLQGGELNTFTQLGIDNPMEVAWEIIPFSFVADWFLPVGEYLRSLTATSGLVFVHGYKSIRDVNSTTTSWFGDGSTVVSGAYKYGPLSGNGTATILRMNIIRSKLLAFPTPSLPTFRDPRRTKDDGLSRATSAIALLQSLFLKQKSSASKYL